MATGFAVQWIAQGYGCKRGLSSHIVYMAMERLGRLERYKRIDWSRVKRLVFVCKGNISRSPYAEVVAKSRGVEASSFGLASDGQSPADPTALRVAMARGVDLTSHRSRSVNQLALGDPDLLLGMEPRQCRDLARMLESTGAQVSLLGLWASKPRPHLQDPYGLGEPYYRTCYSVIDSAISGIVACLQTPRSAHARD